MTKILQLQHHEARQAAEVLEEAFGADPLMLWVFGTNEAYKKFSKAVFETWVHYALLYGKVYRTENFSTVALLKLPETPNFGLWGIIRSGMICNLWSLGLEGWKRLLKYDELSKEYMLKHIGDQKSWYLWMFGTKKEFQGQGLGNYVLQHIDKEAAQRSQKAYGYIEATTASSARLYKRNGYSHLGFFPLPSGEQIDCLGKEFERTSSPKLA